MVEGWYSKTSKDVGAVVRRRISIEYGYRIFVAGTWMREKPNVQEEHHQYRVCVTSKQADSYPQWNSGDSASVDIMHGWGTSSKKADSYPQWNNGDSASLHRTQGCGIKTKKCGIIRSGLCAIGTMLRDVAKNELHRDV